MPRPDLVSQGSAAAASAGEGDALALVTRLWREPDLGVALFWRAVVVAWLPWLLWLTTDEGRADLRGTGVASVTVCRCEAEAEAEAEAAEVGAGLPASLGVTGRRFAREGVWRGGGWREEVVADDGAAVEERSQGILPEDEAGSLEEEDREVCKFLIVLAASCRMVRESARGVGGG